MLCQFNVLWGMYDDVFTCRVRLRLYLHTINIITRKFRNRSLILHREVVKEREESKSLRPERYNWDFTLLTIFKPIFIILDYSPYIFKMDVSLLSDSAY